MKKWEYRVVVGLDEDGLYVAATNGLGETGTPFEIMTSTIRSFSKLDSNYDPRVDVEGGITAVGPGLIALARRLVED